MPTQAVNRRSPWLDNEGRDPERFHEYLEHRALETVRTCFPDRLTDVEQQSLAALVLDYWSNLPLAKQVEEGVEFVPRCMTSRAAFEQAIKRGIPDDGWEEDVFLQWACRPDCEVVEAGLHFQRPANPLLDALAEETGRLGPDKYAAAWNGLFGKMRDLERAFHGPCRRPWPNHVEDFIEKQRKMVALHQVHAKDLFVSVDRASATSLYFPPNTPRDKGVPLYLKVFAVHASDVLRETALRSCSAASARALVSVVAHYECASAGAWRVRLNEWREQVAQGHVYNYYDFVSLPESDTDDGTKSGAR